MENSDDIRLIVKIAQLYYEQDMTQAQIARELGIYRTTISRLLKRGRDQGIVTIAINYDYNENLWLEQQVKQKFGLKDVVVVSGNDEDEDIQLAMMGLHGAQLLDRLLEPGDIVGFSWGRAVSALVENLPQAGLSTLKPSLPTGIIWMSPWWELAHRPFATALTGMRFMVVKRVTT